MIIGWKCNDATNSIKISMAPLQSSLLRKHLFLSLYRYLLRRVFFPRRNRYVTDDHYSREIYYRLLKEIVLNSEALYVIVDTTRKDSLSRKWIHRKRCNYTQLPCTLSSQWTWNPFPFAWILIKTGIPSRFYAITAIKCQLSRSDCFDWAKQRFDRYRINNAEPSSNTCHHDR